MSTLTSPYRGSGQLTREQFLFYEMRTTAQLLQETEDYKEVTDRIVNENLFQYPTEKSVRDMVRTCLRRLEALDDPDLVRTIAAGTGDEARQICLYAMMRKHRLVWDFMITVIGAKYRQQDFTFSRREVLGYIMLLQEQDSYVAEWSEGTIKKIVSVLISILVQNEYIDNPRANRLNPVLISRTLENSIRSNGQELALVAFNCLD